MLLIAQGPGAASLNSAVNQMTNNFVDGTFGNLNFNHLEYVFLINMGLVIVGLILVFVVNPTPLKMNRNSYENVDENDDLQPLANYPQAGAVVASIPRLTDRVDSYHLRERQGRF